MNAQPTAHHTDEQLAKMAASSGDGDRRVAAHLARITDPAARDRIIGEATCKMNMVGGGRWSDCVREQVDLWLTGRFTGKYSDVNAQIIAAERANPGTIFYPEQFGVPVPGPQRHGQ